MSNSSLSDVDLWGSDDSNEDSLDMEDEVRMIFQCVVGATNSYHLFNANEWIEGGAQSVNPNRGIRDLLEMLRETLVMFKTLTNFIVTEFEELCTLVCPYIAGNARSTGALQVRKGRRSKLTPEQRLLNFIWFMKFDNVTSYDLFHRNSSRSCVCDDAIFVASCICKRIEEEIRWPHAGERLQDGHMLPEFPGCIGFIDGTLIEIRKPWDNPNHARWFNGRKKMYSMNNTVVVDHKGLFIHVDPGYPGSFHDVTILEYSEVYGEYQTRFIQLDGYHEYLLGDPGYQGEEQFIMRRLSNREMPDDSNKSLVKAYNKMYAGYQVRVEWGIGGLKQKWRRLMKRYDATMPKYDDFFTSACLMTNFIHRCMMDFSYKTVGTQNVDVEDDGWEGDY